MMEDKPATKALQVTLQLPPRVHVMTQEKLTTLITEFIYAKRAEWRLYPDIYAAELAEKILNEHRES